MRAKNKKRAAETEPRSFNERRESVGSTPLWADLQKVCTFYLIKHLKLWGGKKNTLKSVPKPIWQSYTTADEPLNSLSDRSENWFMPYLADCGSVEKEFKYACRFVDFCNHTNE